MSEEDRSSAYYSTERFEDLTDIISEEFVHAIHDTSEYSVWEHACATCAVHPSTPITQTVRPVLLELYGHEGLARTIMRVLESTASAKADLEHMSNAIEHVRKRSKRGKYVSPFHHAILAQAHLELAEYHSVSNHTELAAEHYTRAFGRLTPGGHPARADPAQRLYLTHALTRGLQRKALLPLLEQAIYAVDADFEESYDVCKDVFLLDAQLRAEAFAIDLCRTLGSDVDVKIPGSSVIAHDGILYPYVDEDSVISQFIVGQLYGESSAKDALEMSLIGSANAFIRPGINPGKSNLVLYNPCTSRYSVSTTAADIGTRT